MDSSILRNYFQSIDKLPSFLRRLPRSPSQEETILRPTDSEEFTFFFENTFVCVQHDSHQNLPVMATPEYDQLEVANQVIINILKSNTRSSKVNNILALGLSNVITNQC